MLSAVCGVLALLAVGGGFAAEAEKAPVYGSFVGGDKQGSEDTTDAKTTQGTWTVTPGDDRTIVPSDDREKNPLLEGAPLVGADKMGPKLPDGRLLPDPDDPSDVAKILRSDSNMPAEQGVSFRERLLTLLRALAVAAVGALIGIAVELWRARQGKVPDPARNIKLVK